MSILAYVGLPGSGKSYDVVANQIMPALQDGRRVVTNIPLNRDAIREVTPKGEIVDLPMDAIIGEPHKIDDYATPGCLLVIDEVWRLWPAGEKTNNIPQAYKSLLAEHRHRVDVEGRSMQIVFATQDLSQVAAFARQLVEQTFHHTKLSDLGASGSYRIDVFHGAVTGAVPPVQNRLREMYGKYKPSIFKLYQSHTMSKSSESGAYEASVDGRGQIWKRPSIWLTGVATLIAVAWGASSLGGIVSDYSGGGAIAVGDEPAAVVSSTSATHFARQISRPVSAPLVAPIRAAVVRLRLVGTIENHEFPDRSIAMLTDGRRITRIALSACKLVDTAGSYSCDYQGALVDVFGSTMK